MDVDALREIAEESSVESVPTFALYRQDLQEVRDGSYALPYDMTSLDPRTNAQYNPLAIAGRTLSDLGADVVKVERPGTGDICRQLYISDLSLDGDSTLFHSINRNKRSYAADLKNPADLAKVKKLVARADVCVCASRRAHDVAGTAGGVCARCMAGGP